ncbi:MAG: helix-turn-helix transcriptional regulator [Ruminococcus sp.]|nr:helix-turn-helix transcriptional regulator [Ruminococcus sp.]
MRYEQRLRQLRIENGFTQERLAKILHIDVQEVADWEEGRAEPSVRELYQLSALYEVKIDDILEEASLYIEMEQATDLATGNQKQYIVGATGKNNDEINDILQYNTLEVDKIQRDQNNKQNERNYNPPTIQENSFKQCKFWIIFIILAIGISLLGTLTVVLFKNKFWVFLALLPVCIAVIWATIKRDRIIFMALEYATLLAAVCITITLGSIH